MAVSGPVHIPAPGSSAPDAFTVGQWEAVDQNGGGALVIDLFALPSDNGSVITGVQYRIDGGAWTSLGLTAANTATIISGLTDTVEVDVELQATNAIGDSPASDVKSRTPTTATFPAASTGSLWQGPSGLTDFMPAQPFVDLVKQSRIWPNNAPTDTNGWPNDVSGGSEGIFMLSDMNTAQMGTSADGHYEGTFAGTGTFTVQGPGVSNVTQGAGTFEFDYVATAADSGILISITDTDTGGNHLREFTCIRDDNVTAWQADATALRPEWQTALGDRGLFRFMDWIQTNESTLTDWADRPTLSTYSWSEGVPVEVMVSVCNRTGVGGWFCIPHECTDDYTRQFSRYVRDNLNPVLPTVWEYSNELWNPLFSQYTWCATQADVVEGWGTGGTQGLQYAGKRGALVMDQITNMFADQTSRIEKACGVQTDWQALSEDILEAPLSVAQGNPAPYESFDSVAVTGYFSGGLVDTTAYWNTAVGLYTGTSPEAAYRYMADLCRTEINTTISDYWTDYEILLGTYVGGPTRLVMYEGGSHVTPYWLDPAPTDPTTADEMNLGFHESPYLYQLLVDAMNVWDSVGSRGPWNYFGDFGEGPWAMTTYPGNTGERLDIASDYNTGTAFSVYNIGLSAAVSTYACQHSLWNHGLGLDINNQNVPNWIDRLGDHAGVTTAQNGIFGQLPDHADYPDPRTISLTDEVAFSEAPSGWTTDFSTSAFDTFVVMADNFVMEVTPPTIGYEATDNYPVSSGWSDTSWTAESQLLFSYADTNNAAAFYIYAHMYEFPYDPPSVATAPQYDSYLTDVRGLFSTWHETWHDDVLTAQPTLNIRLIPYGEIWAELAQDYLTGMDQSDWFEDNAPHGNPSMYLIAAAIVYSAFYGERVPVSYVPPSPAIHADIISNWATICQVIWDRLVTYEDGSGDNRVFPPGTI